MSETVRVFVNAAPIDVAAGSDVRSAIRAADPALAERADAGEALVTDARGIDLPLDAQVAAGSILRVVVRARRGERGADAEG
ncbi:MAG TPA: hypothetical protein VHR43_05010 [Gemmatimonadales bacterium]|jgi:hypothetical protein|nr:hypothetical protein [Gemmatimonadales bacterium]